MKKKVLIIGKGISGASAAAFLKKRKKEPVLVEDSLPGNLRMENFEQVVLSPGVPLNLDIVKEAFEKKIEVIGEAELGLRSLKNPIIGITGTNGKTSTVMLVAFVLNYFKKKAVCLGNIGKAITSYEGSGEEILVVELSSFQLETMKSSVLDIACILNITPDHLDRHGDFVNYVKAKYRIKECLKEKGKFIELKKGSNEMAAERICREFGISGKQFARALLKFEKPEHRLEFAGEIGCVSFYNDSKATNPEAVIYAIKKLEGSIILIAGGVDKGLDFTIWGKAFGGRVRKVIVIGSSARKIKKALGDFAAAEAGSLAEAVNLAYESARKGEKILLSPGCSSFDQFQNYEHRGEVFKDLVRRLKRAEKGGK